MTMIIPTPPSTAALSSTTQVIIKPHMNNNPIDCRRWLLMNVMYIEETNQLLLRLSTVLGVDDDTEYMKGW